MVCEYPKCNSELDTRWQPSDSGGAKLCYQHANELNKHVDDKDVPAMVSFAAKILLNRT